MKYTTIAFLILCSTLLHAQGVNMDALPTQTEVTGNDKTLIRPVGATTYKTATLAVLRDYMKGVTGATGATGAAGVTGPTGVMGVVGPTGTISTPVFERIDVLRLFKLDSLYLDSIPSASTLSHTVVRDTNNLITRGCADDCYLLKADSARFWKLNGNGGTTASTHFVGTTDAQDLVFKVNGIKAGRLGLENAINNNNTAIGTKALNVNAGTNNTALGVNALLANSSGTGNSSFGAGSGINLTTGSRNTFLGSGARPTSATLNWTIAIGYQALVGRDSSMVLGDTSGTRYVGIRTAYPQATLDVHGDVKIADGTQALGKVLTSDANGLARWDSLEINTSAGDAATLNVTAGRFRKDASGSTFTLTNSYITANSIILLTYASDPGITGFDSYVVAGSGSAVITFTTSGVAAAPTADTYVNFWVVN